MESRWSPDQRLFLYGELCKSESDHDNKQGTSCGPQSVASQGVIPEMKRERR